MGGRASQGRSWLSFLVQTAILVPLFLGGPCVGGLLAHWLAPEVWLSEVTGFLFLPLGVILGGFLSNVALVVGLPFWLFGRLRARAAGEDTSGGPTQPWWTPIGYQIGPLVTGAIAGGILWVQTGDLLGFSVFFAVGGVYGAVWMIAIFSGAVDEPD